MLIGIFWTRLGTPTGRAKSGTVEEIQRHVNEGRPAMIYFCDAPASLQTVDQTQYAALQEFRTWCATQGLIETFLNTHEFLEKLRRQLQISLQKNEYLRRVFVQSTSSVLTSLETGVVDEFSAIAATLSPEAKELLIAAAGDSDGIILAVNVLGGRIIEAGNQQFGQMDNRRTMAKWDYGLQQLLTLGLVEASGEGGKGDQVFQIIERGYQVADYIREATP